MSELEARNNSPFSSPTTYRHIAANRTSVTTPPPPFDYDERACPEAPHKERKTAKSLNRNVSTTELGGMKDKWQACRQAIEAEVDDDTRSIPAMPPQAPNLPRPRLFSRDVSPTEEPSGRAMTPSPSKTMDEFELAENTISSVSSTIQPPIVVVVASQPSPHSPEFSTMSALSEETPIRRRAPTNSNTPTATRRTPLGRSQRKVSSTELPSFADAWKQARRSLELEEAEEANASQWVGSKPQLFRSGSQNSKRASVVDILKRASPESSG